MKSSVSPSLLSLMLAVAVPACVPPPKPEYNITTTVRPSPPELQGGGPDFDAAVDLGDDGASAPTQAADAASAEVELADGEIEPPPAFGTSGGSGGAGGGTASVPPAADAHVADAVDVAPVLPADA